MTDNDESNEREPFDGFRSVEGLNEHDKGLFAFVMGLCGDGAGLDGLTDAQKVQRIEQRLLQDADD